MLEGHLREERIRTAFLMMLPIPRVSLRVARKITGMSVKTQ